jgi:hypothetical protein
MKPGWALPLPAGQQREWRFGVVTRGALREEVTESVDRAALPLWVDELQEEIRFGDDRSVLIDRLESDGWRPGKVGDLLVLARERAALQDHHQAAVSAAYHYPTSDAERVALHCRRDRNGQYGTLTLQEWQAIKRAWREKCAYCYYRQPRLVLEHVRPICCRGRTELANVVPSCGPCNRSKRAKSIEEWLGHAAAEAFLATHRQRIRLAQRLLRMGYGK